MVEHTVSFESNTFKAHSYKLQKYNHSLIGNEAAGQEAHYKALEVGSRGLVNTENKDTLKNFLITISSQKPCRKTVLVRDISSKEMTCSYINFYRKFDPN